LDTEVSPVALGWSDNHLNEMLRGDRAPTPMIGDLWALRGVSGAAPWPGPRR